MKQPSLLQETLRAVARRYRVPAIPASLPAPGQASPATALAIAIEHARLAATRGETQDAALERCFIEALARMIHEAMRPEGGDPAFQAMVLRHRAPRVREYASLSAHAGRDRRLIRSAVNAIAHPARQRRTQPGSRREALARLHAAASSASWPEVSDTARRLLLMSGIADEPSFGRALTQILDQPALERLQRLEALASDELVQRYRSLWERHGPRSGSSAAAAQGSASRRRGAAVEASAAQALQILARRLEREDAGAPYCVATSMRVPASLLAGAERAKSEWDAVLLRRAESAGAEPVWDLCLLVEAKASADAATTDLPRLLRGLRLLSQAEEHAVYPFETRQGVLRLRGASLRALATGETGLETAVLYCCDAPAETAPRLLSAASRMQLLSAPASMEFAAGLAGKTDGQGMDPGMLDAVWHELLESPRWRAVLHQYPTLRQVRELMVHADDLMEAVP